MVLVTRNLVSAGVQVAGDCLDTKLDVLDLARWRPGRVLVLLGENGFQVVAPEGPGFDQGVCHLDGR